MKRILLIMCTCGLLSACNTIIKTEVVPVDKPILTVPPPPSVPDFISMVDKLTALDAANPGKVGIAYKYDMMQLRALIKIYKHIVDQYQTASQNFDAVNAEIDALYKKINEAGQTAANNAASSSPH